MEWEWKYGLMEPDTKDIIVMAKNMGKANFFGLMDLHMKVNLSKIILKEKALINGLMEEFILEIGKTIRWMVRVYLLGKMVESMKENIKKIKSMDMEFLNGLMEEFIKDFGNMEDNMEKEFI